MRLKRCCTQTASSIVLSRVAGGDPMLTLASDRFGESYCDALLAVRFACVALFSSSRSHQSAMEFLR